MQNWLSILSASDVQSFIFANTGKDTHRLVLDHSEIHGVPAREIVAQISARQRIEEKLPEHYQTPGVIYPPLLNLEQSSSHLTASLKAEILTRSVPERTLMADLTGGFGVDSLYFSRVFSRVVYVEKNKELLDIARHNHRLLGAQNIEYVHSSAEEFLENTSSTFHAIFIDPSRRPEPGKKTITLKASSPDVTALQDKILERTGFLLLKAAPVLDISAALKELNHVTQIAVVSVQNECKELLFTCGPTSEQFDPLITAINFGRNGREAFDFHLGEEGAAAAVIGPPQSYIYEPNAAIMKAGCFKLIGSAFNLQKLDTHSHLYTSDEEIMAFPGRIFKLRTVIPADAKAVSGFLSQKQANIIIRNFPSDVSSLKKKLKIGEGGEDYLIATTTGGKRRILIANRIK